MRLIILSLLVVCASCRSQPRFHLDAEWEDWKTTYAKSYLKEEETKRQMIWEKNYHFVMKHNYEYDLGKHTYTVGMNKFADLTNDEFAALYLSDLQTSANARGCTKENMTLENVWGLPNTVDWRTKGYVTPVKDQKQCGSCWAFSTTGSVEGQHFKETGELVSLSEQNLVDCSGPEGDEACSGGLMDYAFDYIKLNGGIDTEASYPYEAKKGTCRYKPANIGATVSGCVDLTSGDENSLKSAVAGIGPISVAIDASHVSFQLYSTGVYYEKECSSTVLDHGVLAVGYGTENGQDYWLIKNSWGKTWGAHGYLKMSRNRNNNCGVATSASYPLV